MKPKTTVLVGAGMVAKTHMAACVDSEFVHLKGIAARSVESARRLADFGQAEYGIGFQVYENLDAVIADAEVDFVIIATPPNARLSLIEPLAQSGKHILLEKPVGRNSKEAEMVVQACAAANVELGVFFQHRAREASIKAAEIIQSGEFGGLCVAEFDVPWWREQSYYDEPGRGTYERDGGGVLISQAIHTIDLGLSLTGPVRSVTAMSKTTIFHDMEAEDYVVAGLEFENGAVGRLTASVANFPGGAETIKLYFEHGALKLEAGTLTMTDKQGKVSTFGAETGTGGGADPMAFTHEWHQRIIENFVTSIDGTEPAIATGEDALSSHRLIDAIVQSSKEQKVVFINHG